MTRAGAELRVAGLGRLYNGHEELAWEVGVARRAAERYALGATIRAGTAHSGSVALDALGRAWLTPTVAVDLKPGILLRASDPSVLFTQSGGVSVDSSATGKTPAITLGLALSAGEWAVLSFRTDLFSYQAVCRPACAARGGSFAEHWAGLQLGSYPGVIAMAGTLLIGAVYAVFIAPAIGS